MPKLLRRHRDELDAGHRPQPIPLGTEILKSDPDVFLNVVDHVRGPVVEDLDAPHPHIALLHVDPGVRNDVVDRRIARLVLHGKLVNLQPDRDEITVRKFRGNPADPLRRVRKPGDQVLDRHGRKERIAGELLSRLEADGCDPSVLRAEFRRLALHANLHALRAQPIRQQLPELSGALLRINELVDERSFLLSDAKDVQYGLPERKALHPLCTPFR